MGLENTDRRNILNWAFACMAICYLIILQQSFFGDTPAAVEAFQLLESGFLYVTA